MQDLLVFLNFFYPGERSEFYITILALLTFSIFLLKKKDSIPFIC